MSPASLAQDTVHMMTARLIYVAATYLVNVLLGRALGPGPYGAFGVVIGVITIIEVFLMRGLRDGVAKFISAEPAFAAAVKRTGLRLQIGASAALTLAYFAAAPALAGLLGDPSLAPLLRLSAALVPFLSLYNFYSGVLSGKREFGRRSVLLSAHSAVRLVFVLGVVLLGWGLTGAMGGYLAAAVVGAVLGARLTAGRSGSPGAFPASRIIAFALPVVMYSGLTAFLMNIDLLLVKRLMPSGPAAGFYTAAGMLADLPQQIFMAFALTVFPAVSEASAAGDRGRTREYISGSLRVLLLLTLPLAAFISASARPVLGLVYSRAYAPASGSLSILIFGITLLAVFHFLAAVILGLGRPRISMGLAALLVPVDIGLNLLLIPRMGIKGAAVATTLTCLFGACAAGAYLVREFGILMGRASFFRIVLASSVLFLVPKIAVPAGGWIVPLGAALFGAYLLILIGLKELRPAEISGLFMLLFRPRGKGKR